MFPTSWKERYFNIEQSYINVYHSLLWLQFPLHYLLLTLLGTWHRKSWKSHSVFLSCLTVGGIFFNLYYMLEMSSILMLRLRPWLKPGVTNNLNDTGFITFMLQLPLGWTWDKQVGSLKGLSSGSQAAGRSKNRKRRLNGDHHWLDRGLQPNTLNSIRSTFHAQSLPFEPPVSTDDPTISQSEPFLIP